MKVAKGNRERVGISIKHQLVGFPFVYLAQMLSLIWVYVKGPGMYLLQ